MRFTKERDLGVIMQSDLKCSSQCIEAVNTANGILGIIKKQIVLDMKILFATIQVTG